MSYDILKSIIIAVILLAIGVTIICYLLHAKKRGQTCIGCPYSKQCNGGCNGCAHDSKS